MMRRTGGALLAIAFAAVALALPARAVEPAAGRFLVASADLHDPNFSRTVVLLLSYNRGGAVGLVINRPTEVSLSAAFPDLAEQPAAQVVYSGGPVERGKWMLLVRAPEGPEPGRRIFADVHVSESTELLNRLAAESGAVFRVYSGYAGWGPGQLDFEIAAGGWHVVGGDADLVLADGARDVWRMLLPRDPRDQARGKRSGTTVAVSDVHETATE
jgi:putative transcriptional regulator